MKKKIFMGDTGSLIITFTYQILTLICLDTKKDFFEELDNLPVMNLELKGGMRQKWKEL